MTTTTRCDDARWDARGARWTRHDATRGDGRGADARTRDAIDAIDGARPIAGGAIAIGWMRTGGGTTTACGSMEGERERGRAVWARG